MTSNQRIIKGFAIGLAVIIIIAIINAFFAIIMSFSNLFINDDNVAYNTYDIIDVSNIDIDMGASNLIVKSGNTFKIDIPNYTSYEVRNNTLYIKENSHFFKRYATTITLYIPYDKVFESIDIDGGAGNIDIDNLEARKVSLDLGAGKVTISNLDVLSSIKVNGGAGDFKISNGNLNNLDIDMGVGNFDINAIITGRGDIDMGVGNLTINVLDDISNYTFDIDKGVGNITIDGVSASKGLYGNGNTFIKIDGGVGNIKIY